MNNYDLEVKQRWGETDAYKEHTEKTANYSKDKWQEVNDGLMTVLAKFATCKQGGHTADSDEAQALVKELQNYITENYYTCTDEILAGLGQMYVADERFKNNIDKHAPGTAVFISQAIATYCRTYWNYYIVEGKTDITQDGDIVDRNAYINEYNEKVKN